MTIQKSIIIASSLLIIIGIIVTYSVAQNSATNKDRGTEASWINYYENLESLVGASELIVVGEVIESVPEKRVNLIFTMQKIKIDRYIKGEAVDNDSIRVLQTGGELDGQTTRTFTGTPLFDKKQKYILFLEYTPEGHYLVMGGYQGVGKLKNEIIVLTSEQEKDVLGQKMKNMTINDIQKIIEK